MTADQLKALMDWINANIDDRIERAITKGFVPLGSGREVIEEEARCALAKIFGLEPKDLA